MSDQSKKSLRQKKRRFYDVYVSAGSHIIKKQNKETPKKQWKYVRPLNDILSLNSKNLNKD